ncbi:hypothetical protein CDAR_278891 [Caerostris darwini]|uniref:Uncharacterized protein n=1 Tax=Caerostris darwini TaxID=1538125 RepID=A0AAV4WP48_9ARAC|nr:hypothetical protein CDAR_278891 [Caerostris darwini]
MEMGKIHPVNYNSLRSNGEIEEGNYSDDHSVLGLSLSVTSNPLVFVDIRTTCAGPRDAPNDKDSGNINCPHQFRFESSFQKTRPVTDGGSQPPIYGGS